MITTILSLLSFGGCFAFPFLLTVKLLAGIHNASSNAAADASQARFLLNYWLCYLVINLVEQLLPLRGLAEQLFELLPLLFYATKMWLFYGHGCLIVNYYYMRVVFSVVSPQTRSRASLTAFEHQYLDPFVKNIVYSRSLMGALLILANLRLAVFVALWRFVHEFHAASMPFLQFLLNYWCYIDSALELNRRFEASRLVVNALLSVLGLQATGRGNSSPSSSKGPRRRSASTSSPPPASVYDPKRSRTPTIVASNDMSRLGSLHKSKSLEISRLSSLHKPRSIDLSMTQGKKNDALRGRSLSSSSSTRPLIDNLLSPSSDLPPPNFEQHTVPLGERGGTRVYTTSNQSLPKLQTSNKRLSSVSADLPYPVDNVLGHLSTEDLPLSKSPSSTSLMNPFLNSGKSLSKFQNVKFSKS